MAFVCVHGIDSGFEFAIAADKITSVEERAEGCAIYIGRQEYRVAEFYAEVVNACADLDVEWANAFQEDVGEDDEPCDCTENGCPCVDDGDPCADRASCGETCEGDCQPKAEAA